MVQYTSGLGNGFYKMEVWIRTSRSFPYKNIVRPMFPIDPDMADPELNIIMVPSAKHYYGR